MGVDARLADPAGTLADRLQRLAARTVMEDVRRDEASSIADRLRSAALCDRPPADADVVRAGVLIGEALRTELRMVRDRVIPAPRDEGPCLPSLDDASDQHLPSGRPPPSPHTWLSQWTRSRIELHAAKAETRRHAIRRAGTAAVLVVGITVMYNLYWTAWTQGRSQRSLLHSAAAMRIESADVGLYEAILPGDRRGDLARGPGLVPGSGSLRSSLPILVAGHRMADGAPFQHLAALTPGAVVILRQGPAAADFLVSGLLHLAPRATISLPKGPQALILFTTGRPYRTAGRLVVVAHRVDRNVPGPAAAATVRLPGLKGSPVDLVLGMLALVVTSGAWGVRPILSPHWSPWERVLSLAAIGVFAALTVHLLTGSLSPLV